METLETCQPLSIESFSYSWLINPKLSFGDSFRAALDESSFIEMDPNMPPSKRFLKLNFKDFDIDFDFDTQVFHQSSIVDADKLISNGLRVPSFDPSKGSGLCDSSLNRSLKSSSRKRASSCVKIWPRWGSLSKKFLQNYLEFFGMLCGEMRRCRSCKCDGSRVCDTPRPSAASCDSESSIYEAVLHCKRSIGK